MRGRGLWILVALGVSATGAAFVGCGGDEFSFDCEGDECVNADSDASAPDGGNERDASEDASVDAPSGDDAPGCNPKQSPSSHSCVIDEEFGIFVSPNGDDDGGEGTRASPYATLSKGLAEASAASKQLYVCDDGTGYAERIAVDASLDGLAVYGGFDCDSWAYGNEKAKVKPSEPGIVWRFDGLTAGFLLEDFDIEALDAEGKGESSIAVIVNESAGVVLNSLSITAGEGQDGASPIALGDLAESGKDGNTGKAECAAKPNLGAEAVEMTCGAVETSGGRGGDGAVGASSAGNGDFGLPSTMSGGQEGFGQGSNACTVGTPGENGANGSAGKGGAGLGVLAANGWTGASGETGKAGGPGQGGGGGGGGKRGSGCGLPLISEAVGASGGSGGTGGCGGIGGDGGSAGGASIAIVSIDSELKLIDCHLKTGEGGSGGMGAHGQTGGAGGRGGSASGAACNGGRGGDGGSGGPGGGGAGGHSVGIAYKGAEPARTGGSVSFGEAGKGGAPGSGGDATGQGEDGKTAEVLAF